jgi:hypothetical protein
MPADPHIQRLVGQKLAEALSGYEWPGTLSTIGAATL